MIGMISITRMLRIGAGLGLVLVMGCGEWKAENAELTARTAEPVAGMDCATCHAYPLTDRNHDYHLFKAGSNKDLNGEITCLDCHSLSLQSQAVVLFDSIYEDTTGEKWRTLAHPNPGATTKSGRVIRSMDFFGVDTLHQNHPLPAWPRPGPAPKFQEYLTTLAHLNHKIDVQFDARNSKPAEFEGDSARYNPTLETCSAVACHPGPKAYSWGSVAKGLPELKDKDEEASPP
jgi:hypothetical protein